MREALSQQGGGRRVQSRLRAELQRRRPQRSGGVSERERIAALGLGGDAKREGRDVDERQTQAIKSGGLARLQRQRDLPDRRLARLRDDLAFLEGGLDHHALEGEASRRPANFDDEPRAQRSSPCRARDQRARLGRKQLDREFIARRRDFGRAVARLQDHHGSAPSAAQAKRQAAAAQVRRVGVVIDAGLPSPSGLGRTAEQGMRGEGLERREIGQKDKLRLARRLAGRAPRSARRASRSSRRARLAVERRGALDGRARLRFAHSVGYPMTSLRARTSDPLLSLH